MIDLALLSLLNRNDYIILNAILQIREECKRTPSEEEPPFALQQNYLVTLLHMSASSVIDSIDHLIELKIIKVVSWKHGACTLYRFNQKGYDQLLEKARQKALPLRTGRSKAATPTPAGEIVRYMIGKSIKKAQKMKNKP